MSTGQGAGPSTQPQQTNPFPFQHLANGASQSTHLQPGGFSHNLFHIPPSGSNGGGDPGPSSTAQAQAQMNNMYRPQGVQQHQQQGQSQQQHQQQQQQQHQQPRPSPGISQQQMAVLQQMSQSRGPNGQPQWTPQQLQMAMQAMQANGQGQNANAQALLSAAMRGGQGGQPQPQGQGMQQGGGQMGMGLQNMQQGMQMQGGGAQQQQGMPPHFQQQQQQPQQVQQQQQQQQQQPTADYRRFQQMMQNQNGKMGDMSPAAARQGTASPARPPTNMPPPSSMPQHQQGQQQHQQQGQPQPFRPPQGQGQPQLSLSAEQQQHFTQARQALMSSPNFAALNQQQQQMQLMGMQQHMMRMFAQQNGIMPSNAGPRPQQQQQQQQQQNQQHQQPQYGQQQYQNPGMPRSDSAQSMASHGQVHQSPNPQMQSGPGGQQQQQQPLSSLPQHLAPRPASAASHRAPSPHAQPAGYQTPTMQHVTATPPPTQPPQHGMHVAQTPTPYHAPTPQPHSAPSPAASVQSHHSHHTPQTHHAPSPSHMGTPTMPQQFQPGNMSNPGSVQHAQIPPRNTPTPQQQAHTPDTAQQHAQNAQNMLNFGQLRQDQAAAGGANQFGGGYMQNSGTPQQVHVRPPAPTRPPNQPPQQQVQYRPPQQPQTQSQGDINTSDFPFDFRLLHMIPLLNDPQWRQSFQTRQPQTFAAVSNAAAILDRGVAPDVLGRMRQMASMMRAKPQNREENAQGSQQQVRPRPPQAHPQHVQAQPGPPQQSVRPPAAAWQQQGQVRPPMQIPPNARPPPSHVLPSATPHSPAVSELSQASRRPGSRDPKREAGSAPTTGPGMPPPTWVPGQSTPVRPTMDPRVPENPSAIPIREWESALPLPLPIHQITRLPDGEDEDPSFGGKLPSLSEREIKSVRQWIDTDKDYYTSLKPRKMRVRAKLHRWMQNHERETPWWELRKGETPMPPRGGLQIIWQDQKAHQRAKTSHKGRREVRFSPAQLKAMANVEDQIIPVRIDLEQEHWKIKDTFMWNCSDTVVTPELFAQTLCHDFNVPEGVFVAQIASAIRERIREYQDQVLPILPRSTDGLRGKLDADGDEDARALFDVFKRAREYTSDLEEGTDTPSLDKDKHGEGSGSGSQSSEEVKTEVGDDENDTVKIVNTDEDGDDFTMVDVDPPTTEEATVKEERPMTVEEASASFNGASGDDLRFLIKVDIILGNQNLSDTFEWDLNSSVTPEEFAALHVKELGLSGEFATALAHDIHEQIIVHQRSLFLVGHTPGSGVVIDDEVRSAFLPPLTKSSLLRRDDVALSGFTPIFATLTEDEIINIEKDRERDSKRKKRGTRARRGITLPDREPLKTHRTLINPVGPNGQLHLPTAPATEDVVVPSATTSRRAAAIAAQANINMLAQELSPPSPPVSAAPSVVAQRNARGPRPGSSRFSRGVSRASPSSQREGSMAPNGDGIGTPSILGTKRGLREDSVSEAGASPMPSRKRHNGRIDSPEKDVGVKMEKVEDKPAVWHCRNCGVPENLSGGVKRDPKTGEYALCAPCARYYAKKRRPRPVTYTEDEATHRQRLENGQGREASEDRRHSESLTPLGNGHGGTTNGLDTPQDQNTNSAPSPSSTQRSASPVKGSGRAKLSTPTPSPSQSDSGDSDDSSNSGDSVETPAARARSSAVNSANRPGTTPARTVSASGAVSSPGTAKKPTVETPAWMKAAHSALSSKYPLDDFAIVQKPKPADQPSAPIEWRIKCLDCPGRVYTLGPGETLNNFEVHLKNRQHVEKRTAARQAKGRA